MSRELGPLTGERSLINYSVDEISAKRDIKPEDIIAQVNAAIEINNGTSGPEGRFLLSIAAVVGAELGIDYDVAPHVYRFFFRGEKRTFDGRQAVSLVMGQLIQSIAKNGHNQQIELMAVGILTGLSLLPARFGETNGGRAVAQVALPVREVIDVPAIRQKAATGIKLILKRNP